MKVSINCSEFIDMFDKADRSENFSRAGRRKLYEYLEELEESCCTDIEVDVIALCCDYSESDIETVLKDYSLDSLDDLRDNTTVIEVDNDTIIYQAY